MQGWGLKLASLDKAVEEARRQGLAMRALVFINPGNPTGNCLTEEDLQQLVRFAYKNRYGGSWRISGAVVVHRCLPIHTHLSEEYTHNKWTHHAL